MYKHTHTSLSFQIKPFSSCFNPIYKDIHVHCKHTPARTHKHNNAREFLRNWWSVTLCWDRGSRGSGGRKRGGWDDAARGDWREAKTAWEWRRKGTTMCKSLWWKKQRTGGGAWATWVRWWSSISPLFFAFFCGLIGALNLIRTLDCGVEKKKKKKEREKVIFAKTLVVVVVVQNPSPKQTVSQIDSTALLRPPPSCRVVFAT